MAQLDQKLKLTLDEGRILVLGLQVLLGFQYNAVLHPAFEKLAQSSQYLHIVGAALLLFMLGLLLSIPAFHMIALRGELSERLHRFSDSIMEWALLPFAIAVGIDIYILADQLLDGGLGLVVGASFSLLALFFWYGLEYLEQRKSGRSRNQIRRMSQERGQSNSNPQEKLNHQIQEVMTEVRMILPGAQALMGFQTAAFLMEGFEKLPTTAKYIHLASLLMMAFAMILLMAPAAYHRIVEDGENTVNFFRVASRFVIASLVPLALGISGDAYVVVGKITNSSEIALLGGIICLIGFLGVWFGYTAYRRAVVGE